MALSRWVWVPRDPGRTGRLSHAHDVAASVSQAARGDVCVLHSASVLEKMRSHPTGKERVRVGPRGGELALLLLRRQRAGVWSTHCRGYCAPDSSGSRGKPECGTKYHVRTGSHQVDCMLHTFVVESCQSVKGAAASRLDRYLGYWEQVVDSEYALLLLSDLFSVDAVDMMFHWARAGGPEYATLAGLLFEILIHSLATYDMLELFASPCHQGQLSVSTEDPAEAFKKLAVQRGSARHSGTETTFKKDLEEWRDGEQHWYWYPQDPTFHTIDAVIKLKDSQSPAQVAADGNGQSVSTTGKNVRVAYLQTTVSKTHRIDSQRLGVTNEIFVPKASGAVKPLYVMLCPSLIDAREAKLEQRAFLSAAAKICDVRVGYYHKADSVDGSHPAVRI